MWCKFLLGQITFNKKVLIKLEVSFGIFLFNMDYPFCWIVVETRISFPLVAKNLSNLFSSIEIWMGLRNWMDNHWKAISTKYEPSTQETNPMIPGSTCYHCCCHCYATHHYLVQIGHTASDSVDLIWTSLMAQQNRTRILDIINTHFYSHQSNDIATLFHTHS